MVITRRPLDDSPNQVGKSSVPITSRVQREQALTVLARAGAHYPRVSTVISETLMTTGIDVAKLALAVATRVEQPRPLLIALDQFVDGATLVDLESLSAALPRFSLILTQLSVRIAEAMTTRWRTRTAADRVVNLPNLAVSVNNLAVRLGDAGRRPEGLAAAEEAVDLYLSALAGSINNLAVDLAKTGFSDEGLVAAEEAVDLYRGKHSVIPSAVLSCGDDRVEARAG